MEELMNNNEISLKIEENGERKQSYKFDQRYE